MFNIQSLISTLMRNNPAVANNPQAQEMLNVIQSGNAEQGQRIAENILQSRGMSRDEALQQAHRFFGM